MQLPCTIPYSIELQSTLEENIKKRQDSVVYVKKLEMIRVCLFKTIIRRNMNKYTERKIKYMSNDMPWP